MRKWKNTYDVRISMDAIVQHTNSGALPVRQLCHTGRVPDTTEQSSQDDNAQVRDSGLSRGGDTTMKLYIKRIGERR